MGKTYFVNVNFVCNERCIFCAADLGNGGWIVDGRRNGVTLEDVRTWTEADAPGADDEIALAGGEPTIHPDLVSIVRHLGRHCPHVTLFTNGLRLIDRAFARSLLEAGVSRVETSLYGSTPETHDAVTRRRGSFERTVAALRVLGELRRELEFVLEVRLLVSRQSFRENAAIVRILHESVIGVDAFSLNRLVLSADADAADAAISWADARSAINETAGVVRDLGYMLRFEALPLCVYEQDNAEHVAAWVANRRANGHGSPARTHMRYLDPRVAVGEPTGELGARIPLLPPCRICDYLAFCGRIEEWYVERFGLSGVEPVPTRHPATSRELVT